MARFCVPSLQTPRYLNFVGGAERSRKILDFGNSQMSGECISGVKFSCGQMGMTILYLLYLLYLLHPPPPLSETQIFNLDYLKTWKMDLGVSYFTLTICPYIHHNVHISIISSVWNKKPLSPKFEIFTFLHFWYLNDVILQIEGHWYVFSCFSIDKIAKICTFLESIWEKKLSMK